MKDQSNNQPGAQRHAEGEYGEKARERNREQLQSGGEHAPDRDSAASEGGRESRQQREETEENDESTGLERNRQRGR
jgi:hypothetical protein